MGKNEPVANRLATCSIYKKPNLRNAQKITARMSHLTVEGKGGRVESDVTLRGWLKSSKSFPDQLSRQIRKF